MPDPWPRGHRWIRAADHRTRLRLLRACADAPALCEVDAHRFRFGPYSASGALLRDLVPGIQAHRPDLVAAHEIEILSIAPELRDQVPTTHETLTSLAVPEERTRFYSRLRTLRMAHGVVDLLLSWLDEIGGSHCLLVTNLHEADPTDRELFGVALRRIDPDRLRLLLATGTEPLAEPRGPIAVPLERELGRYATVVGAPSANEPVEAGTPDDRAREYVQGDCVDDTLTAAYESLDPARRSALHDDRAEELARDGVWSARLGALALHRERGGDPGGKGVAALREALEYCVNMGFYHATVDYGQRGRRLVGWTELEPRWAFTTKCTTSLLALGRPGEALELYDEARAATDASMVHMQAAYATSMIYTRHLDNEARDHRRARAWGNAAIAYAKLLPESRDRSAHLVFNRNGLALVAMHEGDLPEALSLVENGIAELDRALGPTEHQLHRSVLRHNRSQLLSALGRPDEALVELDAVIAADPNYAEYHLDRGNMLRKLDRHTEARESYEHAIRLSPPFPEVYYNLADTLTELGDIPAALAGFDRVLQLDPDHVDARVNRAGLRHATDDTAGAWEDVDAGLALDPDNPHLLCVRGQLELDDDPGRARQTLTAAVDGAPQLAAAWAARGLAAHRCGDLTAALADLDHAITLDDTTAARFNRAMARADARRYTEALVDLRLVADLDADPVAHLHSGVCLLALGRTEEAEAEFERCQAIDPNLAAEVDRCRSRAEAPTGAY